MKTRPSYLKRFTDCRSGLRRSAVRRRVHWKVFPRQAERKTWQFCRQVQRALNLAVADRSARNGLNDLSSKRSCRRRIAAAFSCVCSSRRIARLPKFIRELGRETPRLRSEVPWRSPASGRLSCACAGLSRRSDYDETVRSLPFGPGSPRRWAVKCRRRSSASGGAPAFSRYRGYADVHLSADVLLGVVRGHILFDLSASSGRRHRSAACGRGHGHRGPHRCVLPGPPGKSWRSFGRAVPARRRNRQTVIVQPGDVASATLSHPGLEIRPPDVWLTGVRHSAVGTTSSKLQEDGDGPALDDWYIAGPGDGPGNPGTIHLKIAQPVDKPASRVGRLFPMQAPRTFTMPRGPAVMRTPPRRAIAEQADRCLPGGWSEGLMGNAHHGRPQPRIARAP